MACLMIQGPARMEGSIPVQGSKNSTLPLLAATLLCKGETVLENCPALSDVTACCEILRSLGCRCVADEGKIAVNAEDVVTSEIPDELMRELRSSIVFLGPVLGRTGRAELTFPGGCEIGARPIDLHIAALKKLGAVIEESGGRLCCSAPHGLTGADIVLPFPSVGATENIMLAAVCAKGITTIKNAAREPEIVDLADFLQACGAKIGGAGESTLCIEGGRPLHGAVHRVIPDRIWAATFLSAAAATGGEICLTGAQPAHLVPVLPVLEEAGCRIRCTYDTITLKAPAVLRAVSPVRTMPYPGFPTDAQAPLMAMTCLARGTSLFVENIFECRYKHAPELLRMGANIRTEGKVAVVEGVRRLFGTRVCARDLRGGAALAVAGAAAYGQTAIEHAELIERGYESLEKSLSAVGIPAWME